jgi:hypothetical protein
MIRTYMWTLLGIVILYAALYAGGCAGCQVPPGPSPGTGGQATGGAAPMGGASSSGGTRPSTGGAAPTTGGVWGTGGAPEPSLEQQVCVHLAALGCPEGSRPNCADELSHIGGMGERASIDLECLLFADTIAQARACKSVVCGGVK